jgi:LytS/YehU family sensor histidine kinase
MIGRNIGLALWVMATVALCVIPIYIICRVHAERRMMLRDGEAAFMSICTLLAVLSMFSLIGWLVSGGLGI